MNYRNPELQHRLAAEYVIGALQGRARQRFERLMIEQPELRQRVRAWEYRLAPLSSRLRPVAVPPRVWQGIRRRLGFDPAETHTGPSTFWRGWAWTSSLLAAAFAGVVVWQTFMVQPQPVYRDLAVLSTGKAEPAWIVRQSADGATLALSGLRPVALPSDRDLELWAIPAGGAPESLGVMSRQADGATVRLSAAQRQRLQRGQVLAISLEPRGGSPTGSPTGPVLFTGKRV